MMRVRGWHLVVVVAILGLLTVFYKGLWGNPGYIPTVLVGTAAPTFEAPDVYTGEIVSLDRYRGKVVVMNFWASWCEQCKEEHANLLEIQRRYGGAPQFVMLGINYQDRVPDAQEFLQIFGRGHFPYLRDVKGTITIGYGVYGIPETFVIDQQGIIRYKHIGPVIGSAFIEITERVIEPLLRGEPLPADTSNGGTRL